MEVTTIKQRFGIIGNDESLNCALEIALRVASTDLSVLVTGESGVGKEFFPQIIHANSARKDNLMVRINCGAIPENLMESELFGYERGAFAGALKTKKGLIELARSIRNFSATKREPSPELPKAGKATSRKPTEEPFSWTKWRNCRIRPRCACSGYCKPANLCGWERRSPPKPMCG